MSELNIEENVKVLIIKALNKYKNNKIAARNLGMTQRNLALLINKYNIQKVVEYKIIKK